MATENHKGPGSLLAQARADLRLTPEDVAGKLRLTTRQIQALEEDDYSGLPGATYVRGHLRSYAMLLGLDPETVLKAHARSTAKPTAHDFSTIAPPPQITSRHHQVRFVTYVVAIVVIGLAIAWWQSRDTRMPVPHPAALQDTPATEQTAIDTTAKSTEATPATVTTAPVPAPAMTKPAEAVPTPAPVPVAAAPAVTTPSGPRVQFVLTAEQDAWVDIRDARQQKLLYETVVAGRRVPLEGVAPINVFLGNAAGTRIEMNGQPVDIERHRRGVFARFTLGEPAAPAH